MLAFPLNTQHAMLLKEEADGERIRIKAFKVGNSNSGIQYESSLRKQMTRCHTAFLSFSCSSVFRVNKLHIDIALVPLDGKLWL